VSKIIIGESAGKQLKLDIDLLITSRLLIQANSGGGKSWLLRRLAEQCWGKVQTIIIDPEGEFFTLREKFGYVLVGEGGETPADVRSAALLAEKFLQLKASAVCDLYEAFRGRPMEQRQWVRAFLEALLGVPRTLWHPVLVIVDEAHKFCPQETPKAGNQKDREIISECKNAMISLSTTGRKRGFCAIWATQRLAKVDKDASAEMFNRMVGMTIEDVDVDRAADLMSVSKEEKRDFRNSLRTLNPGDFYAFGRAITTERKLVKVGAVQTHHPETGIAAKNAEPPPMPEQVKALLPQLADLPQAAEDKARTEAEFKREIRELKHKLAHVERAKPMPAAAQSADPRQIERAVAAAVKPLREQLRQIKMHAGRAARSLPIVRGALEDIEKYVAEVPLSNVVPPVAAPKLEVPQVRPAPRPAASVPMNGPGDLSGPEHKILRAMGELLSIGKEHPPVEMVAAWSGYSPQGGAFCNPRGALRSKGLIDYPQPGLMTLTQGGRDLIGAQEPPDEEEIWRRIQSTCTGPEQKILRALIDHAGQSEMPKEQLAEKAGYSPIGGAFANPVGALRARGLLDYPRQGVVKATDWLFIEGAAWVTR
jgi:hypothetical protein